MIIRLYLSNPFSEQHLKLMIIPQEVEYICHFAEMANAS